jgi:hypothetical protein
VQGQLCSWQTPRCHRTLVARSTGKATKGWAHDAPYAKGNFTFDRVICGWARGLTVLDLRLKR